MTINLTDEDITGKNGGFGDFKGKMLWQAEQSSKFFTPDVERESVKHDMSQQKNPGHKPKMMSFAGVGAETESINYGGQPISEMETDLPAAETQLNKSDNRQDTPQKASLADLDSLAVQSKNMGSNAGPQHEGCTYSKDDDSDFPATSSSKYEAESHGTSKQYLVSDLHQTPSSHNESNEDMSKDKEQAVEPAVELDDCEFDVPDDDVGLEALNDI